MFISWLIPWLYHLDLDSAAQPCFKFCPVAARSIPLKNSTAPQTRSVMTFMTDIRTFRELRKAVLKIYLCKVYGPTGNSQPTIYFLCFSSRFFWFITEVLELFLKAFSSTTQPLRSESQATARFCPPPLNSPCVQPDGAALITSDLSAIGPAQLHQGDPSAVGEDRPRHTKPPWPWSEVRRPGSLLNEQSEAGRELGRQTVHYHL